MVGELWAMKILSGLFGLYDDIYTKIIILILNGLQCNRFLWFFVAVNTIVTNCSSLI